MAGSLTYYAQTMPGVERIAWLEIRERLAGVQFGEFMFIKDQNGMVVFDYAGATDELLALRTTEDLFVLIASGDDLSRDWRDLRTVADRIQRSRSFGAAVSLVLSRQPVTTYRVISRKVGQHQYRRKDFEQAVVKGIERRYGDRWRLVEDWANVIGSQLLCGLRLSDRTMRYRSYNEVSLPASLRPSVAAALVWLSEPRADDLFLEPMCGSGTIAAERALAGPWRRILAGDLQAGAVRAAARNLQRWERAVSVCHWDATRLPQASGSIDKLAVNLPFGKQVGTQATIEVLYPRFFQELQRVLRPGGRAVVLSSEFDLVKAVLRRCQRLKNVTGYSVAVLGQWGRIYVVEKTA